MPPVVGGGGAHMPDVDAVVVDKLPAQRIPFQMVTRKIRPPARVPAALGRVGEAQHELPRPAPDALGADDQVRLLDVPVRQDDARLLVLLHPRVALVEPDDLASHVEGHARVPDPAQEGLVVVAPVADVTRHVHQRLLGEDLAVAPPPDLHVFGLVPDGRERLVEAVAAPAPEELEGVLA